MIMSAGLLFTNDLHLGALFLLYAGPDQILPLVSILGTIIGILLIWWRRFIMLIRRAAGYFSRKPEPSTSLEPSANLDSVVTLEPSPKK